MVLDNAFGSGSFLVAAAIEGRAYIGIEKNKEVHLFKKEKIDYMEVARLRLEEVEQMAARDEKPSSILSSLQPSAIMGGSRKSGMTDVNRVLAEADGGVA